MEDTRNDARLSLDSQVVSRDKVYPLDPRPERLYFGGHHKTDDLRKFGVSYPPTLDVYKMRAISWFYQYQLMQATPKPKHVIHIRFEDFILKQAETLKRLEAFLGIPLGQIVVRPDAVGRWKRVTDTSRYDFEFLHEAIVDNGYS